MFAVEFDAIRKLGEQPGCKSLVNIVCLAGLSLCYKPVKNKVPVVLDQWQELLEDRIGTREIAICEMFFKRTEELLQLGPLVRHRAPPRCSVCLKSCHSMTKTPPPLGRRMDYAREWRD